jgi:hypothetical protein
MNHRLPCSFVVAAALVCAPFATARADPPTNGSGPSSRVGWTVAIVSTAAGGVLTTVGALIDCSRGDFECARWASLGIWSGIGIASVGTIVGLLMVTAARSAPVRVSFSVNPSRTTPPLPHATLVYAF